MVSCVGTVPATLTNGENWTTALAPLASATALTFSFSHIHFDGPQFNRMLEAVFGVGGNKAVSVTISNSSREWWWWW